MRHAILLPLLPLFTLGCAGTLGTEPAYSGSPTSYSASLGSGAATESAAAAPPARAPTNDFVVRPDTLEITFAVTERGSDAQKVLEDLRARVEKITTQIKQAAGPGATATMCGASTSAAPRGKAAGDEPLELTVRVEGSIGIPLVPAQDYWARSQLVAAVARATREITSADKSAEPRVDIAFSDLRPLVKNTEAYRAKLLSRWAEKVRDLTQAVGSEKAPLAIVECTPPGDVTQAVVSLEEIALSLPVSCKLGAVSAAAPRP
jgi:hypothetical protein